MHAYSSSFLFFSILSRGPACLLRNSPTTLILRRRCLRVVETVIGWGSSSFRTDARSLAFLFRFLMRLQRSSFICGSSGRLFSFLSCTDSAMPCHSIAFSLIQMSRCITRCCCCRHRTQQQRRRRLQCLLDSFCASLSRSLVPFVLRLQLLFMH